ncbi:uncharacterized protein SS50377_28840 [Spironucleus salmonicida]|uniref:Uncharacterized protein n=1 Tax=Spironucleus salmonicida TaxID=348837 RepID=A0A9P8LJL3_9EUKA|nr:hypothetical protein SS50377_28840 [Spironucleus salmonicida]
MHPEDMWVEWNWRMRTRILGSWRGYRGLVLQLPRGAASLLKVPRTGPESGRTPCSRVSGEGRRRENGPSAVCCAHEVSQFRRKAWAQAGWQMASSIFQTHILVRNNTVPTSAFNEAAELYSGLAGRGESVGINRVHLRDVLRQGDLPTQGRQGQRFLAAELSVRVFPLRALRRGGFRVPIPANGSVWDLSALLLRG